ncbi:hypothetical protein K435DRAFT_870091 [Dendrothele bispora CBS 962.96]|uniref:Uncharacterized protein n=1 Tax=Dendrothele bispora (strain CBS 962.96) TaxID=1314807 RepID=A0A4S8L7W1_DENBC|nr:hypothetical protein K435DRAFT_870091 [Dendrothele bispora CBS 962.96]
MVGPEEDKTRRGQFPFASSSAFAPNKKVKVEEEIETPKEKKKDDYEKFMDEIGDILEDEGSKLSELRRQIAKPGAWWKSLRHSNSRYAASASSCPDRLTSLTQSAEDYPRLKALANIVTVLCSNVNRLYSSKKQRALSWVILSYPILSFSRRPVEILEAVAEAIPDPSQISPEMHTEISDLTTLFCDINRYFDPPMLTKMPLKLRSQLDDAYSKFVRGKKPRTKKPRILASIADILTTTLRVIDRASDAFPPLKSAVGGALALKDVTQGAKASKTRAQQLEREIFDILKNVSSDSDISTDLQSLREKLPLLDVICKQPSYKRFFNLNRNQEILATLEADPR